MRYCHALKRPALVFFEKIATETAFLAQHARLRKHDQYLARSDAAVAAYTGRKRQYARHTDPVFGNLSS